MSLHKWVGAAAALYLCLISLSGCVILFEHEFYRLLSPDPAVETTKLPRLSTAALTDIAISRYSEERIVAVWDKKVSADIVAEVWLDGRDGLQRRLLHPYTGADLGPAQPLSLRMLAAARKVHTELLAGRAGHLVNGIGAGVFILLAMSGMVTWLSRRRRQRISTRRPPSIGPAVLHRRIGVWIVPFAAMWGTTSLILINSSIAKGQLVDWAYALHTGGGGWIVRSTWAACGLLVTALVLVGLWSWWRKAAALRVQTPT